MEFKEFEVILKDTILEFKEKGDFGFIGFMGSLKTERDLDLVIAPHPNTKKGRFLKTLCKFLELLQKNNEKTKSKLVCFAHSMFQEDVEYISKRKPKDIFLHLVSFPDLTPVNKEVIRAITGANKCYYGDKENLSLIKETTKDYYYNYLHFINCLYSNYPLVLEKRKIHERCSYVLKHNGGNINIKDKTNKEIFFECCDYLDSIAKPI